MAPLPECLCFAEDAKIKVSELKDFRFRMCPRICTICRNSASKLITHHVCECCSERFLKCGGTVTGSSDGGCLEQKPGLLDETGDVLGLHKCALCNDRQTYQESLYWKHVHEDHDGFFLRCSECGEHFRSQKLKTDHEKNHCKARTHAASSKCADLSVIKVEPTDNDEAPTDPAVTAMSYQQTLVGSNFEQCPSATTRCSRCQQECYNVAFLEEHIAQIHSEDSPKVTSHQKLTTKECKTSEVISHEPPIVPFEQVMLQYPETVKIKEEIPSNPVSIDRWSDSTLVEINQCHSNEVSIREGTMKVEAMDVEQGDSEGITAGETGATTSTNAESRSDPEIQITIPAEGVKQYMEHLEYGFRIRTRKQKTFGNYESYYCNRVRPKCKQQCERRVVVIINDPEAAVSVRGSHTCHLLSADSLSRHALVSHKNPPLPQSTVTAPHKSIVPGVAPFGHMPFREQKKFDPSDPTSSTNALMDFNQTSETETDQHRPNNAFADYDGEDTFSASNATDPSESSGPSTIASDGYQFHRTIPVEQLDSYLESYEFGYTFRLKRKNSKGQNKYYICRSIKYRVRPQCERKLRVYTAHDDAQEATISIRGNHTCLTAPISHLSRQTLQRLYSSEKASASQGSGMIRIPEESPALSSEIVENCSSVVKQEVLPS